jgi:hypothetical protein
MPKWDSESIGALLALVFFPFFVIFLHSKQSAINETLDKSHKKCAGAGLGIMLGSAWSKFMNDDHKWRQYARRERAGGVGWIRQEADEEVAAAKIGGNEGYPSSTSPGVDKDLY